MTSRVLLLLALLGARLSAQSPRMCRDAADDRAAALWAHVRQALASVDRLEAQGREPLGIKRFQRTLDRDGRQLSESSVDMRQYRMRPFRSVSAEALSRDGFVVFDSLGNADFRAPNPDMLLSEEFGRGHCFSVLTGSGSTAGLVGLRFEPVASRTVTDVEGVFWLDAPPDPPTLRFVQFSYRVVAPAPLPRAASDVGGRITFEQLPSGNWIARDWLLRVPVLTQRAQLLAYREEGGETMILSPAMLAVLDSIENSRRPPGTITGVVIDSVTMTPFAGAAVWLDSAGSRTRTDSGGAFTLRGVSAGPHVLSFAHPMLDSMGVRPRSVWVRVAPDSTSHAALGGPSYRTLVGDACPDSAAIVTGRVRDVVTGAAVDSAEVALFWVSVVFEPDRPLRVDPGEATAHTNAAGLFAACVPAASDIIAYARSGNARTAPIDVSPGMRRIGTVALALDRTAPDSVTGAAVLDGSVRYQDGTPLSGADVSLTSPEKTATTDSSGRFRLAGIPGGTRVIDARSIGHAPVRRVLDLRPGETTSVTLFMRKVHELDPIVVRAGSGDPSMQRFAELEERRRSGQGYRLNQVDLMAFKHYRLDAVVRALPFVRVRGTSVTLPNAQGRECIPAFWVDGRRWTTISDLEFLSASNLIAVEVFDRQSEVPVAYQGFTRCGAIMVWTKNLVGGGG